MTEEKITLFKALFSAYCREEIFDEVDATNDEEDEEDEEDE